MEQQNIADRFLPYIDKGTTAADRRAGRNVLHAFERAEWHPDWFDRALAEVAPELGTRENLKLSADTRRGVILAVLKRYLEILDANTTWPEHFGTNSASEYIALKTVIQGKPLGIWGVQDYIDHGQLKGELINRRSQVFTRAQLDAFVEWYMVTEIKPGPEQGSRQRRKQQT